MNTMDTHDKPLASRIWLPHYIDTNDTHENTFHYNPLEKTRNLTNIIDVRAQIAKLQAIPDEEEKKGEVDEFLEKNNLNICQNVIDFRKGYGEKAEAKINNNGVQVGFEGLSQQSKDFHELNDSHSKDKKVRNMVGDDYKRKAFPRPPLNVNDLTSFEEKQDFTIAQIMYNIAFSSLPGTFNLEANFINTHFVSKFLVQASQLAMHQGIDLFQLCSQIGIEIIEQNRLDKESALLVKELASFGVQILIDDIGDSYAFDNLVILNEVGCPVTMKYDFKLTQSHNTRKKADQLYHDTLRLFDRFPRMNREMVIEGFEYPENLALIGNMIERLEPHNIRGFRQGFAYPSYPLQKGQKTPSPYPQKGDTPLESPTLGSKPVVLPESIKSATPDTLMHNIKAKIKNTTAV